MVNAVRRALEHAAAGPGGNLQRRWHGGKDLQKVRERNTRVPGKRTARLRPDMRTGLGRLSESPGLVRLGQSGVGGRNGEWGEADRPAMRMSSVPGVKWGTVQGFELREA